MPKAIMATTALALILMAPVTASANHRPDRDTPRDAERAEQRAYRDERQAEQRADRDERQSERDARRAARGN